MRLLLRRNSRRAAEVALTEGGASSGGAGVLSGVRSGMVKGFMSSSFGPRASGEPTKGFRARGWCMPLLTLFETNFVGLFDMTDLVES